MTIPALNDQLLRAIGVGLVLFNGERLELRYANETFQRWFEDDPATDCAGLFPKLDVEEMLRVVSAGGRFTFEVQKRRRRTMVLSLIFSQADVGGEPVIVLECQNITRIRELEAMLASYASMVERSLADVERERDALQEEIVDLLPGGIAEAGAGRIPVKAERFEDAGILIANLFPEDGFDGATPSDILKAIGVHHGAFERIGGPLGCVRARTIGDAYLCMTRGPAHQGLPALVDVAAMFLRYLQRTEEAGAPRWSCAIGIGYGEVIASFVGAHGKIHSVFGPAERGALTARNAAAQMEVRLSLEAQQAIGQHDALPYPMRVAPDGLTAIVDVNRMNGL